MYYSLYRIIRTLDNTNEMVWPDVIRINGILLYHDFYEFHHLAVKNVSEVANEEGSDFTPHFKIKYFFN